jgi:hypothetical protein
VVQAQKVLLRRTRWSAQRDRSLRWGILGEVKPGTHREGVPGQGFERQILPISRRYPGEKFQGRKGVRAMYTGTLINELMAVVERTEVHLRSTERDSELERWYASQHSNATIEAELLGVA